MLSTASVSVAPEILGNGPENQIPLALGETEQALVVAGHRGQGGENSEESQQVTFADAHPADHQVIYLDTDGQHGVTYDGPVFAEGVSISPFNLAKVDTDLDRDEFLIQVANQLNAHYAGSEVSFTTNEPTNGFYSTIYVGGEDKSLLGSLPHVELSDSYWGLSERTDYGNQIRDDHAFVFSETVFGDHGVQQDPVETLAEVISHETDRLLGTYQGPDYSKVFANPAPLHSVAMSPEQEISWFDVTVSGNNYQLVIQSFGGTFQNATRDNESVQLFSVSPLENKSVTFGLREAGNPGGFTPFLNVTNLSISGNQDLEVIFPNKQSNQDQIYGWNISCLAIRKSNPIAFFGWSPGI